MITHRYAVAIGSDTDDEAAAKSRALAAFLLALNGPGWQRVALAVHTPGSEAARVLAEWPKVTL